MPFQFKGFRATRPVVRLIDSKKMHYEVFFIAYDSGNNKRVFRYKKQINKEKLRDRKVEAEVQAGLIWQAMIDGWNPLINPYPLTEKDYNKARQLKFSEAIDYCLEARKKTLATGSYYNYKSIATFIKTAAESSGYSDSPVSYIERKDIKIIISTAKELNDWSPTARNQALNILKSLLAVLYEEERIKFNPASDVKMEKQAERKTYKRLTLEQRQRVAEHLSLRAPAYLDFIQFVFDTGIRPKELLLIKIYDINLIARTITVRAEVAKTNRKRLIPITDDLLSIILKREIHSLDKDWYLFSNKEFTPGPDPYWCTAGARWWRKYVIGDLKIDCKLYGLKHTGADEKILAGIDIRSLKSLYGHSSEQMTEKYIEVLQALQQKEIIDKSPSFAKVVQLKRKEG